MDAAALPQPASTPDDPLIRHKTTHRTVYDSRPRRVSRGDADEVILLNERGEVCEGTITNVFADRGEACC